MLNIDHLRKQAKRYLRWHREHYYPVAARIRAVLPRYSGLPDREILSQPFRLSDAQELVARTVGFESWEALRWGSHLVTQTRTGSPTMTTLLAAEPQLYVRDIIASCEFYSRMLGFSVAFTYGEPAFYGQVVRDSVRLNLRQVDQPVLDRRSSSNIRTRASSLLNRYGPNRGAHEPSSYVTRTGISCCSPGEMSDASRIRIFGYISNVTPPVPMSGRSNDRCT